MNGRFPDRRGFLKQLGALAIAGGLQAGPAEGAASSLPNPVGYATISWPDSQFDEALRAISGLGFNGVQILGWVRDAYPDARAKELRERLQELNLQPMTLSCSDVVLDPAKPGDDIRQLRAYAVFFQRLGGLCLQVTDGGNPNKSYLEEEIRQLGARITEMGKVAQSHGLTLGYHPHFGTIGESRGGLGRVLKATDPRYVRLIADVAHLTLGGADPAEVVRAYPDRLILTHFKDVRADVAALARKNRNLVEGAKYHFCEIGTGIVDFPAILAAFRETQFKGWVIVELDSFKPGPGGPAASAQANKVAIQKMGFRI
jgi:sugar phosphate isomerase/epimerase